MSTPTFDKYRIWMRIRGSITKPSYEGKVDIYAANKDDAIEKAINKCRNTAHWDSPKSDFIVNSIEVL